MGLKVLPMAGSTYSVRLTRGKYVRPDDVDYAEWAERWGIDAATLLWADSAASQGDFQPLRAVLARLSILMD